MYRAKADAMAFAALFFAILAALTFWMNGIGPLNIGLALTFGYLSRGKYRMSGPAVAAVVIGFIALVLRLLVVCVTVWFLATFFGSLFRQLFQGLITPDVFRDEFNGQMNEMIQMYLPQLAVSFAGGF